MRLYAIHYTPKHDFATPEMALALELPGKNIRTIFRVSHNSFETTDEQFCRTWDDMMYIPADVFLAMVTKIKEHSKTAQDALLHLQHYFAPLTRNNVNEYGDEDGDEDI